MNKRFLFLIILVVVFGVLYFVAQGQSLIKDDDKPTDSTDKTESDTGVVEDIVISNIAKQYDRLFVRYQNSKGEWLETDWIQDGRRYHWLAKTQDAGFAWGRGGKNKLSRSQIGDIEKGVNYNELPF